MIKLGTYPPLPVDVIETQKASKCTKTVYHGSLEDGCMGGEGIVDVYNHHFRKSGIWNNAPNFTWCHIPKRIFPKK